MNKTFHLFIILLLFSIKGYNQSNPEIWLIGTAHEENNYITPDSLTNIFKKLKPDLILIELEDIHFTKDFNFNIEEQEELDFINSSNENNSIYNYHKNNNVQVRPFDINGRYDFYRNENYSMRENELFSQMIKLYDDNKFSEISKIEFEILFETLTSYSLLEFSSLKEANSDVSMKFLATKNKINFELMISIVKQTEGLKNWLNFVELRKEYWDKRNKKMAENIIKYANEFKDKKIIVLVGNDHKYALYDLLKNQNISIKNYWEY